MATHVMPTDWRHAVPTRSGAAGVLHYLTSHYLLLPLGAAVAFVWANVDGFSYYSVAHALAFPVNAIAMALFFGLVAQEIFEETAPGRTLHQWRRWVVPMIAAAAGVTVGAIVYGLYVEWKLEPMLHVTWPIVAGVDVAFAYFVVKAVFHRPAGPPKGGHYVHPAVPFAVLLALVSNVIGVVVISPVYVTAAERTGGAAVLMAAAIGVAWWLQRRHVKQFWPYIWVAGGLSWLALYLEGFHPALALLPVVPFMPHARRRLDDLFADEADERGATPRHFEHVWHYHAQAALFLFGLVNAGVILTGYGTGTWATLAALLLGRTAGIVIGVSFAVALGLQLPVHIRAREVTVIALAVSAGFTLSLFFATTLLPAGPLLAELKLGALLSLLGVPLTFIAARLLHVGRFTRAHIHPQGQHRGA
ncbi:MAG: Na+/H+ antiporter NhaA [Vicinamibacterales bacterium]